MTLPLRPLRPTWAEVDLDCIAHNVAEFRRLLGPEVEIMAVVKADAYGHGAVPVARAALAAGAASLAVALIEEGIELRQAGIDAPVLLFGYTHPRQTSFLLEYRLTPSLFDLPTAQAFSQRFAQRNIRWPVHMKIDTGMGRLGALPGEAVSLVETVSKLPGLAVEGVYTHFAAADEEDPRYTEEQLRRFTDILDALAARGIHPRYVHAAHSAAAVAFPGSRFNLVRLGLAMYGHYPSPILKGRGVDLRPSFSLKSRIVQVKEVPAGTAISYGCTYVTSRRSRIATVPVGYADGYSRLLSNRGTALVRGKRVSVVGRVCMDLIMLDVTDVPEAERGDEVILWGRQGEENLPVEEVADLAGTISYETLCTVSHRIPRIYLNGEGDGGAAG